MDGVPASQASAVVLLEVRNPRAFMTTLPSPRTLARIVSVLTLVTGAAALAAKPKPSDEANWLPANGPRTFIGLAGEKGVPELAWKAVPKTDHYELVLARDAALSDVVTTLTVKTSKARFQDLAPGRYFAKVSAIDGAGKERQHSPVRMLDVLVVHAEGGKVFGNGFKGPAPLTIRVDGPPAQLVVDGAALQSPTTLKKPGQRVIKVSPKDRPTAARALRVQVLPPVPGAVAASHPESESSEAQASAAPSAHQSAVGEHAETSSTAAPVETTPPPPSEPEHTAAVAPPPSEPEHTTASAPPASESEPVRAPPAESSAVTAPAAEPVQSPIAPPAQPQAPAIASTQPEVGAPVQPPAPGTTAVASEQAAAPVENREPEHPLPPPDPELTPAPLLSLSPSTTGLPIGFVQRGTSVEIGGLLTAPSATAVDGRLGVSMRSGISDHLEAMASVSAGTSFAAETAAQQPVLDFGLKYLAGTDTLHGGAAVEEVFTTSGTNGGLRFRPALLGGAHFGPLALSTTHALSIGTDATVAYDGAFQAWVFATPWLSISAAVQADQAFVKDAPLALAASLGVRVRAGVFELGLAGQTGIGDAGIATYGQWGGLFSITYRR